MLWLEPLSVRPPHLINIRSRLTISLLSVKVPQILKMMSAGSAAGVSAVSEVLAIVALAHAIAYNVAKGFPFRSVLVIRLID